MRQSSLVMETMKRYLKVKGITYRDIAERLGQSEANIKRIFSQEAISLKGLEAICEAAGLELLELMKMSRPVQEAAGIFSSEQEAVLAKDARLFAFFYLVLSGLTLAQITSRYEFSKLDCGKYLIRLDKLGLLRLHAENRFQLLASRNIQWLADGPLNAMYQDEIKKEFMDSKFSGPAERMRFLTGRLSKQSLQTLSRRIDRMIAEFVEFSEIDNVGPADQAQQIWLLLGYRPWKFSIVSRYRKTKAGP